MGVGRQRVAIRVVVVDDHPAFRRALTAALELVDEVDVVGEAADGLDACDEVARVEPDAVLMDLSMPDVSGIDAMRKIHESRADLPVVFLTAHADAGVERECYAAGGRGFLAKGATLQQIVAALVSAAGSPVGSDR
jgi:DNA-binding NarL/FixJ family response regulator